MHFFSCLCGGGGQLPHDDVDSDDDFPLSQLTRSELQRMFDTSLRSNGGRLIVHGIFARANTKNNNKRVYPKSILKREVTKFDHAHIRAGTALGELDHPNYSSRYFKCLNLANVSHQVLEVHWQGDLLLGTIEILATPSGLLLWELYSQGIRLGVSSRGWASLRTDPKTRVVYVDTDFELITFDFVTEPSTRGAFLIPLTTPYPGRLPNQVKATQIAHLGHGVVSMRNVVHLPEVPLLVARINQLQVNTPSTYPATPQQAVAAQQAADMAGLLDQLLLHSHYVVFPSALHLVREAASRDYQSHLAMFATRAHLADQQGVMSKAELNAIILREVAREEEDEEEEEQHSGGVRVDDDQGKWEYGGEPAARTAGRKLRAGNQEASVAGAEAVCVTPTTGTPRAPLGPGHPVPLAPIQAPRQHLLASGQPAGGAVQGGPPGWYAAAGRSQGGLSEPEDSGVAAQHGPQGWVGPDTPVAGVPHDAAWPHGRVDSDVRQGMTAQLPHAPLPAVAPGVAGQGCGQGAGQAWVTHPHACGTGPDPTWPMQPAGAGAAAVLDPHQPLSHATGGLVEPRVSSGAGALAACRPRSMDSAHGRRITAEQLIAGGGPADPVQPLNPPPLLARVSAGSVAQRPQHTPHGPPHAQLLPPQPAVVAQHAMPEPPPGRCGIVPGWVSGGLAVQPSVGPTAVVCSQGRGSTEAAEAVAVELKRVKATLASFGCKYRAHRDELMGRTGLHLPIHVLPASQQIALRPPKSSAPRQR